MTSPSVVWRNADKTPMMMKCDSELAWMCRAVQESSLSEVERGKAIRGTIDLPGASEEDLRMTMLLSNRDALLVAVPMVGILFAGFFRLDEVFGKPKKKQVKRRSQVAGVDPQGRPICIDPDGKRVDRGADHS